MVGVAGNPRCTTRRVTFSWVVISSRRHSRTSRATTTHPPAVPANRTSPLTLSPEGKIRASPACHRPDDQASEEGRREPPGATTSRSHRTAIRRTIVAVIFAHVFDDGSVG